MLEAVPRLSATCPSLAFGQIVLSTRTGWSEPCSCCPARSPVRTSPGRTKAMQCARCRHWCGGHKATQVHLSWLPSSVPRKGEGPPEGLPGHEPVGTVELEQSHQQCCVLFNIISSCLASHSTVETLYASLKLL